MIMGDIKCCTHCGSWLRDKSGSACSQLYDEDLKAKSGIIKLMSCVECSAYVADKYVEIDGALLLIDLALQSKEAYRHVLLNRDGAWLLVSKMTLLTVICDGYTAWSAAASGGQNQEFFEQEYEFYVACAKVIVALLGFLMTVVVVNSLVAPTFRLKTLVFGLLLAYSSRFFNLMSLLWSAGPWRQGSQMTSSSTVMTSFLHLLFYISSVRVHQVAQLKGARCKTSSWVLMAIAHIVFVCLFNLDRICQPETWLTCLVSDPASSRLA